jgi:hypothetical protein
MKNETLTSDVNRSLPLPEYLPMPSNVGLQLSPPQFLTHSS